MSGHWDRPGGSDPSIVANVLANYVPALRAERDDVWRSRIVLHDFGLVWQHAGHTERIVLVAVEPVAFDRRWDAFLGRLRRASVRRGGSRGPGVGEGAGALPH